MSQQIDWEALQSIVSDFDENVRVELSERWHAWEKDLSSGEVHEVVGGLLARQATLAIELVGNPACWSAHIAPMLLRAMVDLHINLAWILEEPVERSREFILFGLGQTKLQIEHRKANWGDESNPSDKEMVEAMESWLNSQRYSFLTDVNVGSWSETSVRQMALETGLSNFYNFVYVPFSANVHSMWHHIAHYNLTHCENPLHRFHRVPVIADARLDPFHAVLAAKYFDRSVCAFDEKLGVSVQVVSSYEKLGGDLAAIFGVQLDAEVWQDEV